MALEMSTRRLFTFIAAMPAHIDSSVTRDSSISSGACPRTDEGGVRGVAVPAVDDRAGVDGDDVAVLQDRPVVRDAVDDDLVDRGADGRGGEPAVPEEVRLRPVVGDHLARDLVQVARGGAGHRRLTGGRVDGSDHQPPASRILAICSGGLDLHHAAAPFR